MKLNKQRLMEMAGLNELQLGITNPNDDEAMNNVLDKASFDQNQSIEDGYHAIQDNLPFLIKELDELYKTFMNDRSTGIVGQAEELQAIKNEIKIYKDIQVLMDMSALGKLL